MVQNFTLNQCLRLLYNELTPEEIDLTTEIIQGNEKLRREYGKMKQAFDALSFDAIQAPVTAVDNIIEYSNDRMLHVSH